MASVASQLVFHPAVSQSLKFGATTVGRDKVSISPHPNCFVLCHIQVYRAIQFFARFFAWYLQNNDNKLEAARWTYLKAHLGTARKRAFV